MNTAVPSGFVVKVSKNTSNEWDWAITRFGRQIQSGHTKTEKEARADLKKALGEVLVDASTIRHDRSALKLKLRGWVERRPYVATHVFARALDGMGPKEIIATAEQEEKELHRQETERCGSIILPLSTHHLTKPASDVASQLVGLIKALGWKKQQLKAYAVKMFGPSFETGGINAEDAITLAFDAAVKS